MNYQYYNDYMSGLLGYPNMRASISPYSDDLERLYPEVYRVVYPMVCYACDNIRTPVNDELLNMMTDDIYDRVEADGRIDMDVSNEVRNTKTNVGENQENRQTRPRRRNRFLRDLIRILLLRELLRRRQNFPIRPF